MKTYTLILLFSTLSINIFSQIKESMRIMPDSYIYGLSIDKNNMEAIDHVIVNPPSQKLIEEDILNNKDGCMYKIGKLLPLNCTYENSGTWIELEDGTKIWRLRLSCEGSKASALYFDYFSLKKNAKLFVYDINYKNVLGPFSYEDNKSGLEYSIGNLYGNDIVIEYVLSKDSIKSEQTEKIKPDFEISSYAYIFRSEEFYDSSKGTGYGESEFCQVNVNCSEGDNWRKQQRSVVRIFTKDGQYIGYCTGTLVNNTSNDQTPYILTANHCGNRASESDFRQWRFDFHYESPECNSFTEPNKNTFTGCVKRAYGPLEGGSDFLLVEISATPQQLKNINAVYNGWRNNNSGSQSGVSIHHPAGDIKKISTYVQGVETVTYKGDETGADNAHWAVRWTSTQNGHGVTEGGSSGSAIFDEYGYVIGTLSGGSSYCSQPYSSDLYGKMSYHWSSNGQTAGYQLKPWLDPENTGATICDALDPNNSVIVNFTSNMTTINPETTVMFSDISSSSLPVISRTWTFPGGTPSSSNSINPVVTYNISGMFSVRLDVTTSDGIYSETKVRYINVTDDVPSSIFSYDFEDCIDFEIDQFSPCTTFDGDGFPSIDLIEMDFPNKNYTGSFIAFNPSQINPTPEAEWETLNGNKYGACFKAIVNETPGYDVNNNDWFISPAINISTNTIFNFIAKSVSSNSGTSKFYVLISNTNSDVASFSKISGNSPTIATTSWEKYEYDLSSFAGQVVYVAIQCVSDDGIAFLIDDIYAGPYYNSLESKLITENDISIYPNPSNGIVNVLLPFENKKASIKIYDILGKEIKSIETKESDVEIDLSLSESGIYFIQITTNINKITKKIIIK